MVARCCCGVAMLFAMVLLGGCYGVARWFAIVLLCVLLLCCYGGC